jgi:hypothetical protein
VDEQPAVVAANEATWDDLRAVFGTDFASRCMCQRFKIRDRDRSSFTPEMMAERFGEQTGCDDPGNPTTGGLVAYLDGEPVGWCAVEPRTCYPHRVAGTRVLSWKRAECERAVLHSCGGLVARSPAVLVLEPPPR